jgi:ribosomal protein S12 methylthiotransferase accessory factor
MKREMGPAWLDDEAVERTVANFYPLYREPGRHVAALAAEKRGNC